MTDIEVFVAHFFKDRKLEHTYEQPDWQIPIQVGTALTNLRVADLCDNEGINISDKNVNYCELTALYWIWKNYLPKVMNRNQYIGLYHYRRVLDIGTEDIKKMKINNIDAVLPFPMVCEPDIREHHKRYINEVDWGATIQALEELQPLYAVAYADIFSQQYMYNYNILVAKASVLEAYCKWLFPILERVEELSNPKGWERSDRYIGYIGENLLTLYFMFHQKDLMIYHTGRLMLV